MNLVVYRTEVWDLRACHRVCKGVQWRILVSNISYFILALLPISLSVICQTHCFSARSTNDNIARDILFIPVIDKAKILRLSSKANCSHSSIRLHILGRFRLVQLEGQLTEVSHFWMSDEGCLAYNTLPDTTAEREHNNTILGRPKPGIPNAIISIEFLALFQPKKGAFLTSRWECHCQAVSSAFRSVIWTLCAKLIYRKNRWWGLGWGLRRLVEDQYTINGRGYHVSSNVPDSDLKVLNEIGEDWCWDAYWRRAGYIAKTGLTGKLTMCFVLYYKLWHFILLIRICRHNVNDSRMIFLHWSSDILIQRWLQYYGQSPV